MGLLSTNTWPNARCDVMEGTFGLAWPAATYLAKILLRKSLWNFTFTGKRR